MEVSPKIKSQIKSERKSKLKTRNEKLRKNQSPTSLKIPNLKKRRLMFGLAGLSLQKSKLHWLAVAEGLKTLEVLYYLSVVAVSLYKSIGLLWVVSR